MSYLHHIQLLTENFMADPAATMNIGSATLTTKPISYKFGGSAATAPQDWASVSSTKALKTDLSFFSGNSWVVNTDIGDAERITNLLIKFEGTASIPINHRWQSIVECNRSTAFPASYDSQTGYTPDDIYFGRRVSPELFYYYLPRNISYRYLRIKLFDPISVSSGTIKIKDIFIGDSVDLDRAPGRGISHQSVDTTTPFQAESGREYFLERPLYQSLSGIELPLLKRYQVSALKIWSDQMGISRPFWAILDPSGVWDGPVFGASFGTYRLETMPTFTHQFSDYWSASLSLREVL